MGATAVLATMRLVFMCLAVAAAMLGALAAPPSATDLARCRKSCGAVNISYPFGIGAGCFRSGGFELTCDDTTKPPKLFLGNNTEIVEQSPGGLARVSVIFNIATIPGVLGTYNRSWEAPLYIHPGSTSLVTFGCGIEVSMFDADTDKIWGYCSSMCDDMASMQKEAEGVSCGGMGCCAITFRRPAGAFRIAIAQKEETKPFLVTNATIKAFLIEGNELLGDLLSDKINTSTIGAYLPHLYPLITDQPNCRRARLDKERYACGNYNCRDVPNEGYSCTCSGKMDDGNPYMLDGCKEEYEPTRDKQNCSRSCGSMIIPFPFGLKPECSADRKFLLNCTSNQAFIGGPYTQYQVTNISLDEGLLYVNFSQHEDAYSDFVELSRGGSIWMDHITEQFEEFEDFDFSQHYGIWRWFVTNRTCEKAKNTSDYACISANGGCLSVTRGHVHIGYRCKCSVGYQGNPYVQNGCIDINECLIPNNCNGMCYNREGGYNCARCPRGTSYDPAERKCTSTKLHNIFLGVAIGIGCGFGVLVLTLSVTMLFRRWKKGIEKKIRRAYFLKNKGLLLEQLISSDESVAHMRNIFSLDELEKATNNFDSTRILGSGGHGTVYKGILSDQRVVAIKKSKIGEQSETDQFVNEVAMLSQIIHRNVVKLFGCCLESEVPLLVYEFISNGTLYDLLHGDLSIKCLLTWDDRIRIALEAASALAYLHYAASIPIFHRDVKSANILLDDNFTAKVSDFGASRSVSIDETHVVTIVQGTFGYLDPEYYHTGQLTEKSDVYSFGVILVELLTRKRPIFLNCFGEKQNLCHHFLQRQQDRTITEIVDSQVVEEANEKEIDEMASLAEICLRLRGAERPTIKEVELRLQLLKGKITKEDQEELRRDNESEPLILSMSNSTSRTQYDGLTTVANLVTQDVTRCYSMEQELVSWTSLPR